VARVASQVVEFQQSRLQVIQVVKSFLFCQINLRSAMKYHKYGRTMEELS